MISDACLIIAGLWFLLAGSNHEVFSQPELDEIAWAGFFLVVALLLKGVWRAGPWRRQP